MYVVNCFYHIIILFVTINPFHIKYFLYSSIAFSIQIKSLVENIVSVLYSFLYLNTALSGDFNDFPEEYSLISDKTLSALLKNSSVNLHSTP